jgi:GNAT superfamily N-acetyltransferase
MPSVFVRSATLDDVQFLVDVVVVATRAQGRVPDDFDEDGFRTGFAEETTEQVQGLVEGNETCVIEIDGERAGRLRMVQSGDHVELAGIQLLPAHQGHGIGTYLVEQFLAEARRAELVPRVSVERDNPDARRLYERLGFVPIGESEGDDVLEWPADGMNEGPADLSS